MGGRKVGHQQGGSSPYAGSCSRGRIDGKFTTDKLNPLPHTYQTEACRRLRFLQVESGTVITHAEGEFPRGPSYFYLDIAGAAMFRNIVKRLLNDAEEGECDVIFQFCGDVGTDADDLDGVLLGEFAAQFRNGN